MQSKTKLLIVIIILVIGLGAPLTWMFQGTGEDEPGAEPPDEPDQPRIFTTVDEYRASVDAEVVTKLAEIRISATSDDGNLSRVAYTIDAMEGVRNASVKRDINQEGPGVYTYDITVYLANESFSKQVGYLLPKKLPQVTFNQLAVPATVALPTTAMAVSTVTGTQSFIDLSAIPIAPAYLFTSTGLGDTASFELQAVGSGGKISNVLAVQRISAPVYPTDTVTATETLVVQELLAQIIVSDIAYPEEVDTVQLEQEIFNTTGVNATTSYYPPTNETGGELVVSIGPGAPIGEVEPLVPGTPDESFLVADLLAPETATIDNTEYNLSGYTLLSAKKIPLGVQQGDTLELELTVSIIYGYVAGVDVRG